MNDKIVDRCTDPENCRRCSQDADTPHAGIARVRPGSDNHHAPKPEAQAAGDDLTVTDVGGGYLFKAPNGKEVYVSQATIDALSTPASHDAQQPACNRPNVACSWPDCGHDCRHLAQQPAVVGDGLAQFLPFAQWAAKAARHASQLHTNRGIRAQGERLVAYIKASMDAAK